MNEPPRIIAGVARGSRMLGVTLIALGALSALAPALTGAPVIILVGLLVSLAGVARTVFGWHAWSAGKGPLGLLIGALAVACGLALVVNPVSTLEAVSALVAAYMIVDGVSALLFSSRVREDEGRSWVWGDALISIGLGLSMWVGWPLSGLRALGVLVGVKLASAGAVVLQVERGMQRVGAGIASLRANAGRPWVEERLSNRHESGSDE
jgi:uncharacterized membrane protein HdeD (DUF308 family)